MLDRRARTAVRSLGAALILLVAVGTASALPKARERWIQARTPHFLLFSNAPESVVGEIGLRLERLRHVLSLLPGELDLNPHRPTYIYVFKDWSSSKPYFPQDLSGGRVGGVFLGLRTVNYVLINASPELDPYSLIYHEYLHAVIHQNFPNLPLWLQEGMAEFYSTFWADEKQAEIGGVIDEYLQLLRAEGLMPLHELFAVTAQSQDYQDLRSKQRFHAQSWALVHYLMMAQTEHRLQLWAYVKRQQSEALVDPLTMGVFPLTTEELELRLKSYLRGLEIPRSRLRSADWLSDADVSTTPMSRKDAAFRLGDLLVHRGTALHGKARRHFELALRLDPDHAPSHAGMGLLALAGDDLEAAAARFEKAVELEPDSGYYAYLLSRSLLRQSLGPRWPVPLEPPPPDPRIARARELLEKATSLSPDFAEARIRLGYTRLFDREGAGRGIEMLESARRMVPGRMDAAYYLLVLYLRAGLREQAIDLARGSLSLAPEPSWGQRARIALEYFEAREP